MSQLEAGRPLTLTNADMTRFLMPLSEAVDLVCHALANAETGDTCSSARRPARPSARSPKPFKKSSAVAARSK